MTGATSMQGVILSEGGTRPLILGDDGVRYTFTLEEWRSDNLEPVAGTRVDFEVRGSNAADIFAIPGAAATLSARPSPMSATEQGAATSESPAGKGLRTKWWRWAAAGGALLVLGVIIAAVVLGNPTSSLDNLISPNAERIAFVSDRDGDLDIYVMNPDGSDVTRLTDILRRASRRRFHSEHSPDRLCVGVLASQAVTRSLASWSPDGLRIAFDSDRDGNRDIYVVNADGSGATSPDRRLPEGLYPNVVAGRTADRVQLRRLGKVGIRGERGRLRLDTADRP